MDNLIFFSLIVILCNFLVTVENKFISKTQQKKYYFFVIAISLPLAAYIFAPIIQFLIQFFIIIIRNDLNLLTPLFTTTVKMFIEMLEVILPVIAMFTLLKVISDYLDMKSHNNNTFKK